MLVKCRHHAKTCYIQHFPIVSNVLTLGIHLNKVMFHENIKFTCSILKHTCPLQTYYYIGMSQKWMIFIYLTPCIHVAFVEMNIVHLTFCACFMFPTIIYPKRSIYCRVSCEMLPCTLSMFFFIWHVCHRHKNYHNQGIPYMHKN